MTTARDINQRSLPDERQLADWLAEFCADDFSPGATPPQPDTGHPAGASPAAVKYYPATDDLTRVIGEVLGELDNPQPAAAPAAGSVVSGPVTAPAGIPAGVPVITPDAPSGSPVSAPKSAPAAVPSEAPANIHAGTPFRVPSLGLISPRSDTGTVFATDDRGYSPQIVPVAEARNAPAKAAKPSPASRGALGGFPVDQIRADFPILGEKLRSGKPLIWLDNGATTQRPRAVINRLSYYFEHENSNIHRAAHELAARSTDAYEDARSTVAKFIGAPDKEDIVFVRGTTEAINLVAQCYVKPLLRPGDEIILSLLEHHANIVPWQLIAAETGAKIRVIPVDADGQLVLSEYVKLFNARTKFVSVTHVSNVLGTITPVAELIQIAHRFGVRVLIDGAQSVAHIPINVTALDADFFVFSGHKVFAPTGIGAVYGKRELLEEAAPYHGGGNMIADVTFERTLYNPPPNKFEAGTGSIADAIGLGAALKYLLKIGMPAIFAYEHELTQYGMRQLATVPGLHLIGTAKEKSGALSFYLDGHDTPSVGKHLSDHGIAVRAGHHCAQPILRHYGLESSVRPSLAMYNTPEEIDILTDVLKHLVK